MWSQRPALHQPRKSLRRDFGDKLPSDVFREPDRNRIEVGVEEPTTWDVSGGADDLDVGAVGSSHAEACLDVGVGQLQRLLDPERVVARRGVPDDALPPWRGTS